MSNFRDVGGLKAIDGRTLKTGVLFRSDELSRMTQGDIANLQGLNIKLICDLRSPKESRKKQPSMLLKNAIRVVNIPMHEEERRNGGPKAVLGFLFGRAGGEQFREFMREFYHHIAFERMSRIREVITLLSQEKSLPAVIHCTAGKDRTGYLAALIQLLAGVPYELVREHYLQTNDYFRPRVERIVKVLRPVTLFQVPAERMRFMLMAHPEVLDEVYGNIIRNHGSVEGYLREACAIEGEVLESLKRRLFE